MVDLIRIMKNSIRRENCDGDNVQKMINLKIQQFKVGNKKRRRKTVAYLLMDN